MMTAIQLTVILGFFKAGSGTAEAGVASEQYAVQGLAQAACYLLTDQAALRAFPATEPAINLAIRRLGSNPVFLRSVFERGICYLVFAARRR